MKFLLLVLSIVVCAADVSENEGSTGDKRRHAVVARISDALVVPHPPIHPHGEHLIRKPVVILPAPHHPHPHLRHHDPHHPHHHLRHHDPHHDPHHDHHHDHHKVPKYLPPKFEWDDGSYAYRHPQCPHIFHGKSGDCTVQCTSDHDCHGLGHKCCSNGCGTHCTLGVVNRPGRCPSPSLTRICHPGHHCSRDHECDHGEKCCDNNCGEFICRPSHDLLH